MTELTDDAASDQHVVDLTAHEADVLLELAELAIRARLARQRRPVAESVDLPPALQRPTDVFVTLHVAGELNGCVGRIDHGESLAVAVPHLATKAAFEDPRLPALEPEDLTRLSIEVSLLSARVIVPAASRAQLLRHVRRGEHGLAIRSGDRRALFLPAVWRQLPEPDHFLDQLLRKAGLTHDSWPDDLMAAVFTTATTHRHLDEAEPPVT